MESYLLQKYLRVSESNLILRSNQVRWPYEFQRDIAVSVVIKKAPSPESVTQRRDSWEAAVRAQYEGNDKGSTQCMRYGRS